MVDFFKVGFFKKSSKRPCKTPNCRKNVKILVRFYNTLKIMVQFHNSKRSNFECYTENLVMFFLILVLSRRPPLPAKSACRLRENQNRHVKPRILKQNFEKVEADVRSNRILTPFQIKKTKKMLVLVVQKMNFTNGHAIFLIFDPKSALFSTFSKNRLFHRPSCAVQKATF